MLQSVAAYAQAPMLTYAMPIHRYCYRVIVRLRRTRGSAVNGHGYGGFGSWLQRRQPSTMSAGWCCGFLYVPCAASLKVTS
ncbi:hypothetical protein [Thiothrix winogradskyi]|uniref:Uncharacterized protein n=1 Tax=Thiothrix winogradskyi TaxID=96472 RepID=A0ABY3T696_9GAMM|nr:hypothetical protein [Thiothrix winogradskyi]UJS26667.1 hypothetical protein L2Y54_21480 [Thiothrix winogradskyi]